jgi:hypothetical protein
MGIFLREGRFISDEEEAKKLLVTFRERTFLRKNELFSVLMKKLSARA